MLELMCWAAILCEDLPNDGRTFESAVTRLKFVRAALMMSDAWGNNLYADSLGTVGAVDDGERVRVAAALRRGVALSSARGSRREAIARASSLYGPALRQKIPEFERLFTTATGLSFEEYLAKRTNSSARSATQSSRT